ERYVDEEQQTAQDGEDDVEVDRHSVISRTFGSHTFAWRSMTFSGFVSTVRVPLASAAMWKSWSGFGAGPPFTTAVCLSYREPWHGQWHWSSALLKGTLQP